MRKLNAINVYLIYSGSRDLFFAIVFTVNLVYQATVVHLNPLQLVLVGTLLEASIFVFEIPTGVVADVYSRRLSVIMGMFLIGVGFITEGSFPYFGTVLLCQVLWGLGYTFTSGATDAWIADEVGEVRAGGVFLRGTQAGFVGGMAGAAISVALGSLRINVPIIVGGVLFLLLGVFLVLFMPEHGFTPKLRQFGQAPGVWVEENWRSMETTFRGGLRLIRGKPTLITILVIGLFFGLYSEGFDRLWTPHLIYDIGLPKVGNLSPVVWFGVITVGVQLLSLGVTELARRKLDPDNPRVSLWALAIDNLAQVLGLVVFALSRNFVLALTAYWSVAVTRGLKSPYFTAWVNRRLTTDVRATVLSMTSQVDALGQIAGGPILGLVGNAISIQAALLGSAVLLAPVLLLFARSIERDRVKNVIR
ncbi:MAG: MFS transporter [Anaerolineaceae bacterium]|nr:MFS transporter [Anaerolineaceae bacterium]